MFKSARWRNEKNKIKAVFKLQFHATQLKQLAGDTLVISVIPADTGKPTAKLEKGKVKDGSCYWENPHYETVKFIQDPKNGKFHEKIYHFVLATGSSKSNGVGEVSIDFASFAEATKTSSLSLPLRNAKCAAILHVSIQRVQESLDQRDVDGNENENRHDRSLRAQLSNKDVEESFRSNHSEDHEALNDNIKKDRRVSSGSDVTLSSSDTSSIQESEPKNSLPTHEPPPLKIQEHHDRASQWDWLDGSPPELSTDDSSISPGEPLIGEEGSPDDLIKKLKIELEVLARQYDVSEMELQSLRKQIVKERKKGQDLAKEVITVKEERNALKEECEKLKKVKVKVNNEGDNPWVLVDELKQELNYEKDLNSNLRIQIQKTQESNTELILAVQDLEEMLEQKESKSKSKSSEEVKPETDDEDEDQKALEDIVREHSGTQEAYLLEQKITDLYGEIELYKKDKEELEQQMDQIALDYEILKQGNQDLCYKLEQSQLQEQLKIQYECSSYSVVNELEAQIEMLNNEIKMKSEELSDSFLTIEELKTHVKNLEKDLEDQADGFEADLEDLINQKIEVEKRAIRAEESLRKMKIQNVSTAERLQEDFKRLSSQMNSSFEANEKVAMKAMDEANQLRVEKRYLEETVKKVKEDLECLNVHYEEKTNQITLKSNELEKMKKQIEDFTSDKQNLENEIYLGKIEVESLRKELNELMDANKMKESEIECLESRCNEMKLLLVEDESEKEKMKNQISELKCELKKSQDSVNSMEKKVKVLEGGKTASRNTLSSKEATILKNRIELLEGEIEQKETVLKSSESLFLQKEKDLENKIKELEKRFQDLEERNAISEAARADEMEVLKRLNKSMEEELLEMQERYSEISLKFAEVEGERQKLVMTLRNVKNAKKR